MPAQKAMFADFAIAICVVILVHPHSVNFRLTALSALTPALKFYFHTTLLKPKRKKIHSSHLLVFNLTQFLSTVKKTLECQGVLFQTLFLLPI